MFSHQCTGIFLNPRIRMLKIRKQFINRERRVAFHLPVHKDQQYLSIQVTSVAPRPAYGFTQYPELIQIYIALPNQDLCTKVA